MNALPKELQDGKGRISIIIWGQCPLAKEEDNSPPMLTDNTRGNGHNMHAGRDRHHHDHHAPREQDRDRDRARDNDYR